MSNAGLSAVPEVFPPTLREVMIRPRWLAMLALCLVVAGVFAWLGQWQLSRAVDTDPTPPGATEAVQPLRDVVQPGEYLPAPAVGQRVQTSGTWVPGDFVLVDSRFNDGEQGFWVTGQFRLAGATEPTSIAVAIGWAREENTAREAMAALDAAPAGEVSLTGRLISDEGPVPPPHGADPLTLTRMSPAALLSRWQDPAGLAVYRPYLVSETAVPAGLVTIVADPPEPDAAVNWLNAFYAAEWAVFAGFAFYLWYRLARDAWEREVEEMDPGTGTG